MKPSCAVTHLVRYGIVALAWLGAALPAQPLPSPASDPASVSTKKRLPPAGIPIPAAARAELAAGAAALADDIAALHTALAAAPNEPLQALLPEVEIFHKAVDWALRYDEFFDLKQIDVARRLLATGRERAAQLRDGRAPWTEATGLVIRAYRSRIDNSVQPYALVIPDDWRSAERTARRLDVVLAGRNEKRTELAFIDEHEKKPGEIVPAGGIVLHPYGRFCNATKFAGEADVFEALEAVRNAYPVDPARIVVRGFSMGGASTWHLATHFPGLWCAAAPGAGFAETAVYNKVFAPGKPERTWWEQKLWRWYDATGYAANLAHLPTIAYSGEIDPQKQAADIMEKAMAAEGLKLEHLVGPQTAHKYHPETRAQLAARLDEIVAQGRAAWPAEDRFTTYTPRYSRSRRIAILELEEMWERADVHVRFPAADQLEVTTRNAAVFSVVLEKAEAAASAELKVTVDGQPVKLGLTESGYSLAKENGRWVFLDQAAGEARRKKHLRKTPGLSGPIDDAFMEPFLFVRPTGAPLNDTLARWTAAELSRATKLWRDLFRGDVQIKDDVAITADDIASKHLVLWGDALSNRLLAKILEEFGGKLPFAWDARTLTLRGKSYNAAHHAPVLIFPNPLSPRPRYMVVNSGIDFRDEAWGTNSQQVAKLPDFAVVDLREPPGPRWPGKIVDAGFFDAAWR